MKVEPPTSGYFVEWFDAVSFRWRLWWVYDSAHQAECAAGHCADRTREKVRIEYRAKLPDTLF
jgi:hypothetical protein